MVGHFGGPPPSAGERKTKVVALMFVATTLLVAFGGLIYISKRSNQIVQVTTEQPEDARYAKVLYPVRKIQRNENLDRSMFRVEPMARDALPDGAVTDVETINGKFAKVDIVPREGDPLLNDYITHVKPPEISKLIKEGFRAITIRVDNTTGVEGWARPGTRVDVLWTTRRDNENKLITLVKNAEVLSADRQIDNSGVNVVAPTTVTLQVSDQDSKKITLAQTSGSLNLVLRGDDSDLDNGADSAVIDTDDLIGARPVPVAPAGPVRPACEGTVVIDGKKFCVVNGRMVPVDE